MSWQKISSPYSCIFESTVHLLELFSRMQQHRDGSIKMFHIFEKYTFLFLHLLCALILINPLSSNAQSNDYLPIELGKQWVLHSNSWNIALTFEVTEYKEGTYRLKIHNPWMLLEMSLFPVNDKVFLQSLAMGDSDKPIGGLSLYYDFNAPVGKETPVGMGKLTVVGRSLTVTTDRTTYTDCIKMELLSSNGFKQGWTFAPNVGFVEYEFAGTIFRLNESASRLNVTPTIDLPAWQGPVAKGERILAIDANPAENNNYLDSLAKAVQIGAQTISLHFDWRSLEPTATSYKPVYLDIANAFYPPRGLNLSLVLAPIHNNNLVLPPDLQGLPFDDPLVVSRFKMLLDFVFAHIPNINLTNLVIGSEIDAYLGTDLEKWEQYISFYSQIVDYAHQLRPQVSVTTEFRFIHGYLGRARPFLEKINEYSDVIGVSYYPLTLEGMVINPEVLTRHFKTIVDGFPNKPIQFLQLGFPSSSLLQSDENLQAAFVKELFKAWDLYAERINLVRYTFMTDFSVAAISNASTYFGDASPLFKEFLSTLGLRRFLGNGTDKLALLAFDAETHARGW